MPVLSPAQKELLLLWILLTANSKFSPGGMGMTAEIILAKIVNDFRAAGGSTTWNFDNLTINTATEIIKRAVSPANSAAFSTVNQSFKFAARLLRASESNPWPADLPDHPSVAELKAALGI